MLNHLELFSGTFSFSKVSSGRFNVISLDKYVGNKCPLGSGYISNNHIDEDIMTWDYKKYPKNYFYLITASPVCSYWSALKDTNIGKISRKTGDLFTRESIFNDILNEGMPQIDKLLEILDYFQPNYFIIENPSTSKLKLYLNDLIPKIEVDYCSYSDWGYRKRTLFWTNIEGFNPIKCSCTSHIDMSIKYGGQDNLKNKYIKYRIPQKLIQELINRI